jgi:excinuclease ABC subunit C
VDLWQSKQVPVVALAKQREELFLPQQELPGVLPVGSQELFLVQRMRDEAHRFAITYYRLLHKKSIREQ